MKSTLQSQQEIISDQGKIQQLCQQSTVNICKFSHKGTIFEQKRSIILELNKYSCFRHEDEVIEQP